MGTNSASQEISFILGAAWKRPLLLWGSSEEYAEVIFFFQFSVLSVAKCIDFPRVLVSCYWIDCFHNSTATDLRDLRSAAMRWHIRVTTKELPSIVRGAIKPSSALVPYALLVSLICTRLKAEPWQSSVWMLSRSWSQGGLWSCSCPWLSWLAAAALCQQCPSLAHTPRFPEASWNMAGLLQVALLLFWGHTDLPSPVWKAEEFVPSFGRDTTVSAVF